MEDSEVLFPHLHGETEEIQQKLEEKKKSGCGLRIEAATSKIRNRGTDP
jgi:ribosomal protein L29